MEGWFTLQTLIAFALGVALSVWVKSLLASAKAKVA